MNRTVMLLTLVFTAGVSVCRAAEPAADVKACVERNQREHMQILAMHAEMKKHEIDKEEQAEFAAMEKKLNMIGTILAKGGLTLKECERITKDLDGEREVLAKMAVDPQVEACVKEEKKEHAAIMKEYAAARKAKKLSAAEEKTFGEMEKKLNGIVRNLDKGGLTLKECERITKDLNVEREVLDRMAKN